ncbi:MAG TPA: lysozyme inhibitor LprI family protein [Gemmatimonadales bacterium]|nr:lysozyme inhibitor LprI family protein [Gemmatimonadales bacterium]
MTTRGWVWASGMMVTLAVAGCSRPDPALDQPAGTSAAPPQAAVAASAQADPCGTATSQMELNLCKAAQARTADSLEGLEYNAATAWLKKRKSLDQVPLLDASEQAWKAYRDAQCKAEGGVYAGGSLAPTIVADCQARENRLRLELLKRVYADPVTP